MRRSPVCHGYGMTECPMITQGSPSDTDEQLANTDGAPVRRLCGAASSTSRATGRGRASTARSG